MEWCTDPHPSQDSKIVKTSEQRDWQCFRQNQINCYWNNVIATNHRQSEFLGTIFAAFQRLQFSVLADWRRSSLAPSSLLSHTLVSTEHLRPRISGAWTLLIYSGSCQFWRDGRTRQYMDLSIALCRGWWWRGQAGEMAGPHITVFRLHCHYVCICNHNLIWIYLAKRWVSLIVGVLHYFTARTGAGLTCQVTSSQHQT